MIKEATWMDVNVLVLTVTVLIVVMLLNGLGGRP